MCPDQPAGERPPAARRHPQDKLARGLSDDAQREFVHVQAELLGVLDGRVPRTGLIVVTGPAGSGKSTLVSELGLQLERAGERMVVLDAEMGDELATATWTRGGATKAERMGLRRIASEDAETGEEIEWSHALQEAVRLQASVLVVDSLDEWGDLAGRDVVLADLRRNGPIATTRLVIAIAHFARDGHLFGTVKTDHRADAVVIVEPERISQNKCTWHPRCEMARKAKFVASKGGLTRQKRR